MSSLPISDSTEDADEMATRGSVQSAPPFELPPLPRPLSSIVGRTAEIEGALALLRRDGLRLLTLTGPGGVGKTRLSLELAAIMQQEMQHGVVFIDLSQITDPALVLPAIAQNIGFVAGDNATLTTRLAQTIGDAQLLLVLDNLEQVITSGVEIAALLTQCPGVKALVTSRTPLRVQGEQELVVPTLPVPSRHSLTNPDQNSQNAAVSLFVQRAQATHRDFELTAQNAPIVAEICARLDGLPLAIELAAARTRVFSVSALLDRLSDRMMLLTGGPRDLPSRLQTMRDAIRWSYDLLAPEEQAVFRRLSLFSGSLSFQAATDVVSPPIANAHGPGTALDILEGLSALIDQSLINRNEPDGGESRYRILETIRDFGIGELRTSGEYEEISHRFCRYFADLVHRAKEELTGPNQVLWMEQLDRDVANLRLAMQIALQTTDERAVDGLEIASGLWRYWLVRGQISEGSSWLERMASLPISAPVVLRAEAANNHGNLVIELGQLDRAREFYLESRELYKRVDDQAGIADELNNLGLIELLRGDFAEARVVLLESLAIRRALGDDLSLPSTLTNLGDIAMYDEDYTAAERYNAEAYQIRRNVGNIRGLAFSCHSLGLVALYRDDLDTASRWFAEGIAYTDTIADTYGRAFLQVDQGMVSTRRSELMPALESTTSALQVLRQTGSLRMVAEALDSMASAAVLAGRYALAARLLGGGKVLRDEHRIGYTLRPRKDFAALTAQLTHHLGDDEFVSQFEIGQARDMDTILDEALGLLHDVRTHGSLATPGPAFAEATIVDRDALDRLGMTPREREVLVLLVHGFSDKEIADYLHVSPRTAMTHVANVLNKLGVNKRTVAATVALRDQLVDPAAPLPRPA